MGHRNLAGVGVVGDLEGFQRRGWNHHDGAVMANTRGHSHIIGKYRIDTMVESTIGGGTTIVEVDVRGDNRCR